jgi:hypothetical protein
VVSGQLKKTPSRKLFFSGNVAQATAPVPANDYHEASAEDNSRFDPEVEGGPGAPSLNWQLTTGK